MRHRGALAILVAAAALCAVPPALAQSAFSVPFGFESGGKKLPAGNYVVAKAGEAQATFHHVSTGKEWVLPLAEKLKAEGAEPDPRLVFDEVGNFEPSYTEYYTVYVLAELWLSGQDGYLVHRTKGGHKNRVVKGEAVKKAKPPAPAR